MQLTPREQASYGTPSADRIVESEGRTAIKKCARALFDAIGVSFWALSSSGESGYAGDPDKQGHPVVNTLV